jgi:hypothetical protein
MAVGRIGLRGGRLILLNVSCVPSHLLNFKLDRAFEDVRFDCPLIPDCTSPSFGPSRCSGRGWDRVVREIQETDALELGRHQSDPVQRVLDGLGRTVETFHPRSGKDGGDASLGSLRTGMRQVG